MSLSLSKKRRLRENQECSVDENENDTSKRLRRENDLSQSQLVQSARCGKIIRIHLQNFMCHGNLKIDFHERVNFLVGSNGSGKSAIMAALVLGLGSKARATNRSGNMKQFIKTGERSAKIEITFSNSGPQAFEHKDFGDSVTVVRNITQNGANFVIKNHYGNVISKKIDDLKRILIYHNMQVDNPIFVLNQDASREFLKELNPQKNYSMFLKATQMEWVEEKLNECYYSHKEQLLGLKSMKKKINICQIELRNLNDKLQILINQETLKDKVKYLKLELAWSKVNHYERELNEYLLTIESLEKQRDEIQRDAGSKSDLETKLNNDVRDLEVKLSEKKNDFSAQNDILTEIKRKVNDVIQNCTDISSRIDTLKKRKCQYETSIAELKDHIQNHTYINIDERKRKDEIKLETYRRSLDEVKDMILNTKRDMKMFIDNKNKNKEIELQLREKKNEINKDIHQIDLQISSLNPSAKDKLSAYGYKMVQLDSEIEKSSKAGIFSKKPVGPLGSYIEVPNSEYRDVIEGQLGSLMKAFIVNNTQDRQSLGAIIQRVCPQMRFTIITTKFQDHVYDTRNGCVQPRPDTRALINEIKCSNPVVMNFLIDRLKIETVLLTDNKRIAEQISSQIENVPANMTKIIVPKHGLEYFPEPKYRMYSLNVRPGRYIQVDAKQRVAALDLEKQEKKRELEKIERKIRSVMILVQEDSQRLAEKREMLQGQEKRQNNLETEINEITKTEYPESNQIDILKQDLNNFGIKISKIDEDMTLKKRELNDLFQKKECFERDLTEQKSIMQNIQKEIELCTQNVDQVKLKLRRKATTYKEVQKTLQAINEQINNKLKEKERKESELYILRTDASKLGERISTDREEDEITDDISKAETNLRQRTHITENIEDLRKSIHEKTILVEEDQSVYEKSKLAVEMLGKSLRIRYSFVQQLKQHMALLLQYAFDYLLKARNFVGSVEVNHSERTLVLSVIPRDNHLNAALSNTRALSGGERSYTTVAFLIALWSCVDHPFYFLDEYDVFTDVVNRDSLNKLLVNEGKVRPDRQYTFLTPQDMSLESSDVIKIHRLARPE